MNIQKLEEARTALVNAHIAIEEAELPAGNPEEIPTSTEELHNEIKRVRDTIKGSLGAFDIVIAKGNPAE